MRYKNVYSQLWEEAQLPRMSVYMYKSYGWNPFSGFSQVKYTPIDSINELIIILKDKSFTVELWYSKGQGTSKNSLM